MAHLTAPTGLPAAGEPLAIGDEPSLSRPSEQGVHIGRELLRLHSSRWDGSLRSDDHYPSPCLASVGRSFPADDAWTISAWCGDDQYAIETCSFTPNRS
jgi:hypothetical protein